ncbi:hypothetical protein SLEP1_g3592 [Rubroshorea leprosula]|uniref:Uncharacterized protein n=1 Tax=Rubroshorea leprosula TaxID=152421 RepID=A0AAV5HUM9_9ROSI|nr:hypothetical protein SLEP1_g3592 [Rubroshorea leprosula]
MRFPIESLLFHFCKFSLPTSFSLQQNIRQLVEKQESRF